MGFWSRSGTTWHLPAYLARPGGGRSAQGSVDVSKATVVSPQGRRRRWRQSAASRALVSTRRRSLPSCHLAYSIQSLRQPVDVRHVQREHSLVSLGAREERRERQKATPEIGGRILRSLSARPQSPPRRRACLFVALRWPRRSGPPGRIYARENRKSPSTKQAQLAEVPPAQPRPLGHASPFAPPPCCRWCAPSTSSSCQ